MNRLLYIFIALAVSALIAVSCSSSKEAGMPSVTSGEDLSVRGARELASALAEPGDWQTMKIPVNVVLRKPVSVRLGGNMTLVRGKEIRVSLRFLGFEVAAASITGDSVKAHTGGHSARVSYDYPHDVSGGIPSEVALSGSLKGRSVEAYLEYSAGKADRDAGMPGAFSIPRGYRKVSASSLIKLLDSLK